MTHTYSEASLWWHRCSELAIALNLFQVWYGIPAGELQKDVMGMGRMHRLNAQVSAIDHAGISRDAPTLGIQNGVLKIESVEIKRHGAHTQRGKPTDIKAIVSAGDPLAKLLPHTKEIKFCSALSKGVHPQLLLRYFRSNLQ